MGRKAAAQNLADIMAMGARPTALVVGFGAPADLPTAWALELSRVWWTSAELVEVSIVGGDTVQSDKIIVSVTAFGTLDGRPPVLRSGARPGDEVAYIGRLGWAEAGLGGAGARLPLAASRCRGASPPTTAVRRGAAGRSRRRVVACAT